MCFRLENAFTGKTVGIMVKSSKTLQDALSLVMQKHHLKPHEALVTMVSDTCLCEGDGVQPVLEELRG